MGFSNNRKEILWRLELLKDSLNISVYRSFATSQSKVRLEKNVFRYNNFVVIVGSKSGVLWPLNWNHFLTPVLVSQDPIKKNERGYPSRFFWLFEILAILEVVTSSDTHVPLFRNILVRTWGCRISLDSEWWEEAENVYVDISRYWKSRYKCENASNERAR